MRDLFPVVVHTLLWRRGAVLLLRRAEPVTSTAGTRCRAVICSAAKASSSVRCARYARKPAFMSMRRSCAPRR